MVLLHCMSGDKRFRSTLLSILTMPLMIGLFELLL